MYRIIGTERMAQQQIFSALHYPCGEVNNTILTSYMAINASTREIEGVVGQHALAAKPCQARDNLSLSNLGDEKLISACW